MTSWTNSYSFESQSPEDVIVFTLINEIKVDLANVEEEYLICRSYSGPLTGSSKSTINIMWVKSNG